ncbi:MAG: choice-of-anchor D domain-containing protein, partial [Myxococcota bacterium]|nr:choice-of-anchor D domain-containing protein [Myxococcota bacterium]
MYLLFSSLFLACEEEKSSSSGLTVSAESLDFGDQPVGTEETQTLTITNQDFSDISILSLTLIGDGSSVWEVTRGDDTELSTNESLEVSVTYKPSDLGASSPELQIRTTYEDQDKIYIALSGNATESIADEDEDGYSPADGDCNDGNGTIYPNAPELCDGIDNDCDGTIPDDEIDQDIDGF